MKRIWFVQQKPYEYIPLRMGLEYIQTKEVYNYNGNGLIFCPKIYTTRLHPLFGEYYVVEGSRFKAKPVEPRIEFRVDTHCQLDLRNALASVDCKTWVWGTHRILARGEDSFAELDLGVKGVHFDHLRDELLRLNPKADLDTPFYVNKLEPLGV